MPPDPAPSNSTIRQARAEDFPWIVRRHRELYQQEHGWGLEFGDITASVVADFQKRNDTARDRCWIAELDGRPVGTVIVVRLDETTAKLRMLLTEPEMRGQGIGALLVDQCIHFARQSNCTRLTLWTNSALTGARRIYERKEFHLVHQEPETQFGSGTQSEIWELDL